MPDFSSVDFSKKRRPEGPLTPTDVDDLQKFIINPLKDAGFSLNDWARDGYTNYLLILRHHVFNYEYTNGISKVVFREIEDGFEETDDGTFDDIAEKGVNDYVAALKKRDERQTKREKRKFVNTALLSTETPFKKLPPGIVSKIASFAVGKGRKSRRIKRNGIHKTYKRKSL